MKAFRHVFIQNYCSGDESQLEEILTTNYNMTVEEAVLQMNLLEHEFYVFKNLEDEENFAVVYKRKKGGYGLIECAE